MPGSLATVTPTPTSIKPRDSVREEPFVWNGPVTETTAVRARLSIQVGIPISEPIPRSLTEPLAPSHRPRRLPFCRSRRVSFSQAARSRRQAAYPHRLQSNGFTTHLMARQNRPSVTLLPTAYARDQWQDPASPTVWARNSNNTQTIDVGALLGTNTFYAEGYTGGTPARRTSKAALRGAATRR